MRRLYALSSARGSEKAGTLSPPPPHRPHAERGRPRAQNTEESCALLESCGYDGFELRVRYTDGETDVTPDNVLAKAEEIKATVASHGLVLSNFASNQSLDEEGALETVRKLAEGAQACGCPAIRLGCRGYPADGSENYWDIYEGAVKQYAAVRADTPPLPPSRARVLPSR